MLERVGVVAISPAVRGSASIPEASQGCRPAYGWRRPSSGPQNSVLRASQEPRRWCGERRAPDGQWKDYPESAMPNLLAHALTRRKILRRTQSNRLIFFAFRVSLFSLAA